MTTLASLVTRLQSDVPARNSVPSATQYEQAVKDAVAEYSRFVPEQKIANLSIVAGTATYDLPDDFQRMIRLASLGGSGGVVVDSNNFLVPMGGLGEVNERYTINGRTITFYPTPTYTLSREYSYTAYHILNSGDYTNLTGEAAGVVMLKAQAICLILQANKAVQEAWQYSIGDERVAKERLAAEMRAQAQLLEQQFIHSAAGQRGQHGTRARYSNTGQIL